MPQLYIISTAIQKLQLQGENNCLRPLQKYRFAYLTIIRNHGHISGEKAVSCNTSNKGAPQRNFDSNDDC